MKSKKDTVVIKLKLIGVIHALVVMIISPHLHELSLELLNRIGILAGWIILPILLSLVPGIASLVWIVWLLSYNSEYIKFRYVILPFFTRLITFILLTFIPPWLYLLYLRIFVDVGGFLNFSGMFYIAILTFDNGVYLILLIIAYFILIIRRNLKTNDKKNTGEHL